MKVRRSRAGGSVVFDGAVALFQRDPLFWLARGLGAALPAALLAFVFVYVHREIWVARNWSSGVALSSLGLGALVLLAWMFRIVLQRGFFLSALEAVHDAGGMGSVSLRVPDTRPGGQRLQLLLGGTLALGGGLVLLFAGILPGLLFLSATVPLPLLILAEGRDLPSALRRSISLPRGTLWAGFSSLLFFVVLWLFGWVALLLGVQILVWLLRALLGMDVGLLSRALGPGNECFVIGCALLSALLLDPLWSLQRVLIYVDARMGQSGADLVARWDILRGGTGEPQPSSSGRGGAQLGALAVLVLFLGAVGGALSPAQAAEPGPSELRNYARWVDSIRDELGGAMEDYELSGYESLEAEQSQLELVGEWTFTLPGGEQITILPGSTGESLPPRILSPETASETLEVSARLGRSASYARALATEIESTVGGGAARDPRALLEEELSQAGYEGATSAPRIEREALPFLERMSAWLEDFFGPLDGPEPAPNPTRSRLSFPAKWVVGFALLFMLLLVFALAFVALRDRSAWGRPQLPEGEQGEESLAAPLPDARTRTPLGWEGLADRYASEGMYREAVRTLFLAVLARLDQRREIHYSQASTNGEHLSSFEGPSGRRRSFARAILSFELAWFGGAPVGAGSWESMKGDCSGLLLAPEAERGVERV